MNKHIQMAWRNIWRNKRRTIITGASIFFGVVFSSYMTSMQEGSYAQMINTIVSSYSGHIQIYKKGYFDDKVVNNSLEYSPEIEKTVKDEKKVSVVAPRFESYALASSDELTKGVMVMGIQPEEENKITGLSKKIIQGEYLQNHDKGLVIGSSLARYMKLNVNDTLVLLSQGYHGVSAAGKYRITGIIKHPSPDMDRSVVYMEVGNCQEFFSAYGLLTSIVIMAKSTDDVHFVERDLGKKLGDDYEIKDWKEINKVLLKQIESDRASGAIIKGLLYLIIAFGIFSTIMMMTLERKKEFGVLISIGMQKYRLKRVLLSETVFIGLLGSISGIIASFPIVLYYFYHPIEFTGQAAESFTQMGFEPVFSFSLDPSVFYRQAIIILCFTLLIGIYPILAVGGLKVNKALRS